MFLNLLHFAIYFFIKIAVSSLDGGFPNARAPRAVHDLQQQATELQETTLKSMFIFVYICI